MMRPRPAPQSAEQARECIEGMRAAMTAKRFPQAIRSKLLLDETGFTNWSPEARAEWKGAS